MYHDDARQVTLQCENSTMRSVIDRVGESVDTTHVDDGHFSAKVNVAPSSPFFAWVFNFSGAIRIESPDDVLREMQNMAKWLTE